MPGRVTWDAKTDAWRIVRTCMKRIGARAREGLVDRQSRVNLASTLSASFFSLMFFGYRRGAELLFISYYSINILYYNHFILITV